MNDHREIVTQDLRERLVHLGGVRLAAERGTELPLDHAERGFRIRPLVVVGHEFVAAVKEEAEHLAPCASPNVGAVPATTSRVALESNEGLPAEVGDGVRVSH